MNKIMTRSDIFSHFSNLSYLPRWGVLLLDMLLSIIAFAISIAVGSHFFTYTGDALLNFSMQAIVLVIVQVIFFCVFRTFSGIIRYSTFMDILKVLSSVMATTILLLITNLVFDIQIGAKPFLNTVLIIYLPMAFILLVCFRIGVKTIYESVMQNWGHSKKVFIYGTKSAGQAIAKMLRSYGSASQYRPIGFISDGRDMRLHSIQGLKVYLMNEKIISIMKNRGVNDVIISPIKMKEINPAKDLQIFLKNDINILTAPAITKFGDNNEEEVHIGRIESIHIEDLLERPTININTDNVSAIIKDQIVMITGAAGSIGSEIVRQVLSFHPKAAILLEQAESPLHDLRMDLQHQFPDEIFIPIIGDVRNREKMREVFEEYHPDVVFHAAAYKHVPLMEEFPNEAIQANVLGTKNVADLSVEFGVKRFVMISTDKAVNPTNVMGASKRIAEIYVQSLFRKLHQENPDCTKFITTRFGNVLGSNGSVIPFFKKQIAQGGPVTVTHPDIIRFFMTIPEACTLVLEAATLGNGGEIFVFDMGHPVKIADLARNMIRLAGYRPDIDIHITYTGLRPGEKLYEEVLNQKETTLPTTNDKIMIARVREVEYQQAQQQIETLITTSQRENAMNTVAQMKQIVPEFKSKNSIFEQLDKRN